jgi:hypothetical protein
MNSSKENPVYVSEDVPSQPIFCIDVRVLVLSFGEVPFLFFYPLMNLYLQWKPPCHSLKKISVLETEPFVGTGQTHNSTLSAHQQAITTCPFGKTYKVDVV